MAKATLYDRDFLQWTEQQIVRLQKGQWENVDVDHLVEKLGDLGRSEQRELGSYLKVFLMYLLRWQYQPDRRTASWEITLSTCRDDI